MLITEKFFKNCHQLILQKAIQYADNEEYELAIKLFQELATNAYHLNVFYTDTIMENKIISLSDKLVQRTKKIIPSDFSNDRIIFFDSFGWDNRGLTQQYIRALISLNKEFLFIFENFNEDLSKDIFLELQKYEKCKIVCLDSSWKPIEKIKNLTSIIENYQPNKAFLHLSPWCINSLIVWTAFPDILRFQINLTDHAFWLGKNSFDYCIEFRDYGYNISKEYRGISEEQLIQLPYYPIIDENVQFQGFPAGIEDKTILVSGANYYKVFGKNDQFFKLIKKIHLKNPNCVVLFAGSGNRKVFQQLLKKYNLEKIVYLIGNRKDISEVVKQADIYLATYPITGGLMGQFAIKSSVPIIGYSDKNITCNYIESLLLLDNTDVQLTYFDDESFLEEITKMINDENYRKKKAEKLKNTIISEIEFTKRLSAILRGEYDQKFITFKVDTKALQEIYFEVENKYLHTVLHSLYSNRFYIPKLKRIIELKYYIIFPCVFIQKVKNIIKKLLKRLFMIKKIKRKILNYFFKEYIQYQKEIEKYHIEKLKASFKKVGKNFHLETIYQISGTDCIEIGDNFYGGNRLWLEAVKNYRNQKFSPQIIIKDNVHINHNVHIGAINKIEIGENALIASNVLITDHYHGNLSKEELHIPPKLRPLYSKGQIIIGRNVWIGEFVSILGNVKIGNNVVIGANTLVNKDIPDNCIVGGVPFRIIKKIE